MYSDRILLQAQLGYLDDFELRNYMIHYQQPWLLNRFNLRLDTKLYTTFRSELYQGDSTVYYTTRLGGLTYLTKPLRQYDMELGSGLKIETVQPREDSSFNSYSLRSVVLFLEYDRVTNKLNPQKGMYLRSVYEKGGELFQQDLGGVDYLRLTSVFNHYVPITDSLIFAYRIFGGYYQNYDDITMFETEQFSLGGANSLRGYAPLSFYGDYRLSANIEPRYQFTDRFVGVGFIDIGSISDSINESFLRSHM